MNVPRMLLASLLALSACAGSTGSLLPQDEYVLEPLAMTEEAPPADRQIPEVASQTAPEPTVRPSPPPVAVPRSPPPAAVAAPVPSPPPPAATYRVRRGDSLWGIARKQLGSGLRWKEIASLNRLPEPYTLKVGQELRLP